MKKACAYGILTILAFLNIHAQEGNLNFKLEAIGGYTTPGRVPFWMRSNQYGSIPLDNASLSLIGAIKRDYSARKNHFLDWGAAIESRANVGNKSNLKLIEGYGKVRMGFLEIKAGRSRQTIGLCDTSLTSGSFSLSGNALGIPQLQISIPEFQSLPFWGELLAFKGNFVHGWIGETPQYQYLYTRVIPLETYFHQKSLYGRFGKPGWKLKLYGGFNHQTFWGKEDIYYENYFTLSGLEDYLYVIAGKPYGTEHIGTSKIGNHLGSIDLGFEYSFAGFKVLAYRQNIYDIGALYYFANIRDGLNGLSIQNAKQSNSHFQWKKILIEFLFTKNQAGELWSPYAPSGDENYYNNDQYVEGYSYKGIGMGNPLLGLGSSIREELPQDPHDFFVNNRVVALHLGFEASIQKWNFLMKASYSQNYGTFGTSEIGHSLGNVWTPPRYGIFPETKQLSAYLKSSYEYPNGLLAGFVVAADVGKLYYNSQGVFFTCSKTF